jgi:hypothetical protein
MTGCPKRSCKPVATSRAIKSVEPPGAKVTTNRSGRDGQAGMMLG